MTHPASPPSNPTAVPLSTPTANPLSTLRADLPAGLVVFLVALPLCLGIALASGAPLFSGIIAGVVGGIVVGILSGSPLGVSGPAAGLAVIVLNGVRDLGSFSAVALAVALCGALQVIAGYARAGIIGYYMPSSVIKGMLAGIGLTLVLKQIPHALGYDRDPSGNFDFTQTDGHNTLSEIYYAAVAHSPGAVLITTLSLAVILLWDRPIIRKNKLLAPIPAPLIVVLLGVGINALYRAAAPSWALENQDFGDGISNNHLVQIPIASSAQEFFSFFSFPDLSLLTDAGVLSLAFTLALIASLETLLSVEATDKLDPDKRITPTNRELKAQGVGNLISGLLGGLPITQVIVRSSANINSGGQSKLSCITHGLLLLICILAIPSLLNTIPLASLAAILLVIGYKLASAKLFRSMYRLGADQFWPFTITIAVILFSDLLKGILIGLGIALFFVLLQNFKNPYSFLRERQTIGEKIVIRLAEEVSFLNKGHIKATLGDIQPYSQVVIDGTKATYIDYDVLEVLYEFHSTAPQKKISVELININLDRLASASAAH
jgi:MFS superfamily sulfate permease-like transporter